MADTLTKEQRSKNMSAIRGRRTKPELFLRHELFIKGYRFRVNVNNIPGHPDMFLRKYNLAIFVNGCFWHRHLGCKFAYTPKSNQEFWLKKFENNIRRDETVKTELEQLGVRQMIVWECFIERMARNTQFKDSGITLLESLISSSDTYMILE